MGCGASKEEAEKAPEKKPKTAADEAAENPSHDVPNVRGSLQAEAKYEQKLNAEADAAQQAAKSKSQLRKSVRQSTLHKVKLGKRESYEYMDLLGRGGFGGVVRVRHKLTKKPFAMKIMDQDRLKELVSNEDTKHSAEAKKKHRQSCNEEENMMHLNFCFIIRMEEHFHTSHYSYIVLEYVQGKTVKDLVKEHKDGLPAPLLLTIASELLLTIQYVHDLGMVHRDIKPDNVMLASNGHIKMLDFGISFHVETKKESHVTSMRRIGAMGYKAPEMLQGKEYTYSVDWWNYGILLYFMATGKHPFTKSGLFAKDADHNTLKYDVKIPKNMDKTLSDLIQDLLQKDPRKRAGCTDDNFEDGSEKVQQHDYFQSNNVDWEAILAEGDKTRWDSSGADGLDAEEKPRWKDSYETEKFLDTDILGAAAGF